MKGFRLNNDVPMGGRAVFISKNLHYLLQTRGKARHDSARFDNEDYCRQVTKEARPAEILVAGWA